MTNTVKICYMWTACNDKYSEDTRGLLVMTNTVKIHLLRPACNEKYSEDMLAVVCL
jgi:hypothetical protein